MAAQEEYDGSEGGWHEQAEFIDIDGSILEGGGQILRNCVSYSVILNKPVNIVKIRGNRPKPGLQHQHLTGLGLAAKLCDAETTGLEKSSSDITFVPHDIKHGSFVAKTPTAGSCTLLAQISLPIALYASEDTSFILTGGTNVPFSPPVEYLKYVFLPTLHRFGVYGVEIDTVRKGFMPAGGGEIHLKVHPTRSFTSATFEDRGELTNCTAYFTGYCTKGFQQEVEKHIASLEWKQGGKISTVCDTIRVSKDKGSVQLLFVVETENGYRLGASGIGGRHTTGGKLVTCAYETLCRQLEKGLCVDEYLQDQVVIFMALARGTSKMKCGDITLHTQTAVHFARLMTGAVFDIQEIEKGVNIVSCQGASIVK